jgi:hypothetical protein
MAHLFEADFGFRGAVLDGHDAMNRNIYVPPSQVPPGGARSSG